MSGLDDDRSSPSGTRETAPLMIGVIGISIPVALVALAAVGESVVVLVLAVLAMLTIGTVALAFMMRLMTDTPELDSGDAHGE